MKKHLLAILLLLVTSWICAQNLTDSLLLFYPFNGNANDESGNGFDGTSYATLTDDRFGNPNSAFYFDGIDDYIDIPLDSKLKPDLPVSFSFWIKVVNLNVIENQFFGTDYYDYDDYNGCWMNISPDGLGGIHLSYGGGAGSSGSNNRRTKSSGQTITIDTWHHIVGVIRGETDMDIYIDCINVGGDYSGTGGNLVYSNNPGTIGRGGTVTPYYNYGIIDDFAYWNRALIPTDVENICSGGLNIKQLGIQYKQCNVYPNPSTNQTTFKILDNNMKEIVLNIFNSTGQQVRKVVSYNNIIVLDRGDMKSGLYFFRVESDNELIDTGKLSIQ